MSGHMALPMTRPTRRPESSFLTFRKRTPKDILAKAKRQVVTIAFPQDGEGQHTATFTIGPEIKFSLKARDPVNARARTGFAESFLARHWEAIRNGPVSLTHKQTVALSGEVYRLFADGLEDDPGSAKLWDAVLDSIAEAMAGPVGAGRHVLIIGDQQERRDILLEERFGKLADRVLSAHHLEVDQTSRKALLFHVAIAVKDAALKLDRNVAGDYRADPNAARFGGPFVPTPQTGAAGAGGKAVTFASLVAGWWKEGEAAGLSRKTHQAYASAMDRLAEHVGHSDAARITADDIIGLKSARLAAGVSPKTVKDSDLAGLKAILGWAVANRLLPANPAEGITVKRAKAVKLRGKGLTDKEAYAILAAASRHQRGQERPKTFAAKRWVPWLCAYTGARVGEIAQLRKQDVRLEGNHWVVTLTPEAGAVKNKEARDVPLHPHLVEMGFPEFVRQSDNGHLFLTPSRSGDVLGPLQGVKNRLAEFAREVVTDPNVAPNHGWRHRFKTVGLEAGVSERVLDAICGHAPRTVGAAYGDVTLNARADGIAKFPKYQIETEV